jgi:chemotaxis protein CheX
MLVQDCLNDALIEGTREVFETMMFMTVEPCNELYEAIQGPSLLGTISFKGNIEGVLSICCGMDCAQNIAMNMLGMEPDEEISPEEIQDAMGEVSNMVMGAVKSRIMDSVGDVQVSIPSVINGSELEAHLENAQSIKVEVAIDEFMACLTVLYRESN